MGISANLGKKRDLTNIFGTWTRKQYYEFQKNTENFNQIDSEIWLSNKKNSENRGHPSPQMTHG